MTDNTEFDFEAEARERKAREAMGAIGTLARHTVITGNASTMETALLQWKGILLTSIGPEWDMLGAIVGMYRAGTSSGKVVQFSDQSKRLILRSLDRKVDEVRALKT